jgi:hypothetical protein
LRHTRPILARRVGDLDVEMKPDAELATQDVALLLIERSEIFTDRSESAPRSQRIAVSHVPQVMDRPTQRRTQRASDFR